MNRPVGGYHPGRPIGPASGIAQNGRKEAAINGLTGQGFKHLLQEQLKPKELSGPLKISHHAQVRMQQRGIELDQTAMQRLQDAVGQAAAKGAKDALVLMRDQAFIVSVNNRTIVTAMDANDLKEHVVTQIDSAVIIPTTT